MPKLIRAISLVVTLAFWRPTGALSDLGVALSPADNLLGSGEFFVCNSHVVGMNGRYVRESIDEGAAYADPDTPVFLRQDDDPMDNVALADVGSKEHDFRLLRIHGFWMFADVGDWPPTTHFRCDPTKLDQQGDNLLSVCGMNLPTPPRFGYSPVVSSAGKTPLVLQVGGCGVENDATPRPPGDRTSKVEL